jgi:excisionase family DNA binding protein
MGNDRRPGGDQGPTDQGATDLATGQRLTVPEAAEVLGISGDAVRSRIKRGTLPTVREGGRVFVVLGATDRPTAQAQPTAGAGDERLYQEMQERIRYLEGQVEEEREARRRADTLLAQLMQRIPELEAPAEAPAQAPEARESPETVEEPQGRGAPRPDTAGAQEGVRRPWWRRIFNA